ncbi:MAG: phosphotransferase [Candidatus Zixiibacteriota bacterium]|nr:MAG: phosphotransferase [candidate division Zixibacteria bacterium]
MLNETKNTFEENSEHILDEAAARFDFSKDRLRKLGGFESMVYEFDRDGKTYVLKANHSLHRTEAQIYGELYWLNYLLDNGVSVCRPVAAHSGKLVEVVELDGSCFMLYAFEKATGRWMRESDWKPELYRKWGAVLGRVHALAKRYKPPGDSFKRFEWHEDVSLDLVDMLPESDHTIKMKFDEHLKRLRALPTDENAYGLIHCDMHHSNFLLRDGQITVLDFDDCLYSWFVNDIAIPLFYALREPFIGPGNKDFVRLFMSHLLSGYNNENRIDPVWLRHIPDFLKLREFDLYMIITTEGIADSDRWCRDFMKDRKYRLENEIPVIDFDFSVLDRAPNQGR